ncbi:MAG: Uma2 family endonuclease [Myxococcales bacterium]|nr:Uma2 family endonuclease [Myxococcales bacterium]
MGFPVVIDSRARGGRALPSGSVSLRGCERRRSGGYPIGDDPSVRADLPTTYQVINPTVLVEVTSRSTEKRDRGIKLDDYRLITSLREYVIVSHIREELEVWSRADAATPWIAPRLHGGGHRRSRGGDSGGERSLPRPAS